MALFQPTNILPDMLSGAENGTVFYDPNDSGATTEISWTVNGNSPLRMYKIDFFKNNASSTLTDSTGQVLIPPFYAVSSDGTETRYSCTVPTSYFVNAADAANGYTGKFKITQYWGLFNHYVEQRSASVFRLNGISSVSVGFDSDPGFGGVYNFKAVFTAPNPDHFETSLVWTRWQILNGDPIQDTGMVWGASDLTWTCQQLLPGYTYMLKFTAMTSMGEELSAYLAVPFGEDGDFIKINGAIEAACDKNTKSVAVSVKFGDAIPCVSSPNPISSYIDNTGHIILPSGATVSWDIPQTLSNSKWGFYWTGKANLDGNVVTVTQAGGTQFGIKQLGSAFYYVPGDWFVGPITNSETIHFYLIPQEGTDDYLMYCGHYVDGNYAVYNRTVPGILQAPPRKVEFGTGTGTSTRYIATRDCRIIYGDMTALLNCAQTGASISTVKNPQIALPYYDDALYASQGLALVAYFGPDVSDVSLFRSVAGREIRHLAQLPASLQIINTVYDYGVANDNLYKYFVVYQADEDSPIILYETGYAIPCWWEWTLIEAVRREDGSYEPYQTFGFDKNFNSGSDGNGSSPSLYNNFTPYPIVMRDTVNRHSGTLNGLIGWLNGPGEYMDNIILRDAIRGLSVSKNAFFLRSRKGDFFKVAISGEIVTSVEDNSPKQQVTASIPWVEIGPVDGQVYTQGSQYQPIGG